MRRKPRWCSLEEMPSAGTLNRPRRWYLIPVRVFVVTFIITLLSFAVSLLLGIGEVVVAARLKHAHPNMAFAYRYVAVPAAAMVGAVVLISSSFMEVRHYRRTKALDAIERAS